MSLSRVISRQATRKPLSQFHLHLHHHDHHHHHIAALSTLQPATRSCLINYQPSSKSQARPPLSCSILSCCAMEQTRPLGHSRKAQFHSVPPLHYSTTNQAGGGGGDKVKEYKAADISTDTYHELADSTLDDLYSGLEALSEKDPEVEVDYSSGVMTLSNPDGTWVINKQPPNKQIWLSSPISGPKRYDWVKMDDSGNPREDDGDDLTGDWVYLRDGHTMKDLVQEELGVSYEVNLD